MIEFVDHEYTGDYNLFMVTDGQKHIIYYDSNNGIDSVSLEDAIVPDFKNENIIKRVSEDIRNDTRKTLLNEQMKIFDISKNISKFFSVQIYKHTSLVDEPVLASSSNKYL